MHVVIATAGALPPTPVADFVASVWKPSFRISVMSAIRVPRDLVEEIDETEWNPLFEDDGTPDTASDAVSKYVAERGAKLAQPILVALEARGIPSSAIFVEGHDPADAIVATAEDVNADLIIMGATKKLFDESAWSSISAQVVDRTRIPTLVVPSGRSESDPDNTGD